MPMACLEAEFLDRINRMDRMEDQALRKKTGYAMKWILII
jgi:hypothetical protein